MMTRAASSPDVSPATRRQFVFRLESDQPFVIESPDDRQFFLCGTLSQYLRFLPRLVGVCGWIETAKGGMRLVAGRRFLYGVLSDKQIIHYGWVTSSSCRHYEIEPDAYVIGPIWSSPHFRGRGTATFATKMAINEIMVRGGRIIYIDTSDNNLPCLRVIEKCGFGNPVKSYDRLD